MIVPNRRMNIVHILKPMPDGSTRILEVLVKNTPCTYVLLSCTCGVCVESDPE
jgi:hypothetical protein